jgi:FkbM family methyltransferase
VASDLKSLLIGTPLEPLARAIHRRLRGYLRPVPVRQPQAWARRVARDQAHTRRLLQATIGRTSNCVDVGAHTGEFVAEFAALAPDGRLTAVEALPAYAAALAARFPGITVHHCAVGNRAGRTVFRHAIDTPGWSGLEAQPYPGGSRVELLDVALARLDDLIPAEQPVHFLKVDVEGGELGVFEGARRILTRWRPVVLFEHAWLHSAGYGTTATALHALLVDEYGLAIYSLDGRGPHDREGFAALCAASDASNYGADAETNFVTRPLLPGAATW